MVLHGHGDSGAGIRRYSGFRSESQGVQIAIAYPDGVDGSWAAGCGCTDADALGIDDIGFLHTLVGQIAGELPIDTDRVFVVGFSQGSMMAQRVACQSDLATGWAGVAAGLTRGLESRCVPPRPIRSLLIHGLDDPIAPWPGDGLFLSVPASADAWARWNGCETAIRSPFADSADDGTTAWQDAFEGCLAPVRLIGIDGGGHTWPGSPEPFHAAFGRTSHDITASARILAFFTEEGP